MLRFAEAAREASVEPLLLDIKLLPPEKEPFVARLREVMGLEADQDPFLALHDGRRRALLVDTAEMLGLLEEWFRVDVLPQLPADCLVVFAGRCPPSSAWFADDGWAMLLKSLPLRNLSGEEGRELLASRGVPAAHHEQLLASTHGHPLALSLVADLSVQDKQLFCSPMESPHIVRALLERFSRATPGPHHRQALYVAAHARVTNEGVLRDAVPGLESSELYDWLRSLSFVEETADGLRLHDLAAEVLDVELRRRDPTTYVELHTRLRRRALRLMQQPAAAERLQGATDLCWMYRFSPISRPLVDWGTMHSLYLAPLAESDAEEILAATERFEGGAAKRARAYWLQARPDAFKVVRASPLRARGLIFSLVVEHLSEEARQIDPIARSVFEYVERTAALRKGEVVHLMYAFDYEQAHRLPNHAWVHVEATLRWHCTPNLAWSFVQVGPRARDVVLPMLAQFRHLPGPEVCVGGKQFVLAGHDWRREPSSILADYLADVELYGQLGSLAMLEEPLVVLSIDAFAAAVHDALRDFSKPQALAKNPLCRSRVVRELPDSLRPSADCGTELSAASLRSLLKAAVQSTAQSGKKRTLAEAVTHTYIDPAPSQDIAAELVGLPFSTYRRHLAAGVARATEWLWEREVGGWPTVTGQPLPPGGLG